MPRQLRIEYPGAIYHMMNRGDRREAIFYDVAGMTRTIKMNSTWRRKSGLTTLWLNDMRQHQKLICVILLVSVFFALGCERSASPVQNNPQASSLVSGGDAGGNTNQLDESEKERRQELAEALAYSDNLYKQKMSHPGLFTNPPPSEWPFPNYPAGPGNPLPPYVNFYSMNDPYPAYLLCEYDVEETNYNQTNESKWFEATLEQVRQSGPKRFPPIKWVAVIIINRAEWNGVSTFEQAHKVGAIFKASDVFNPSCDLSQSIAHADMDRHPFEYDTSQPTPGDQQRWLIVEQHAATNGASVGPK